TEWWSASGPKFLFTSDRGGTWVEKLTPDSAVIFDLTFTDSTTGYAVGKNGLILKYKQNTTKVEDNITLPKKIVLHQNFPNPFNPGTSIQYAVSSRQFISLKIYDVLGNEIAVLVNEEKPAGEYEVKFSANGGGKGLTSGIYFYQLWIGSFIQTKKMVYLK
ncbi:MAG: T9SS type A sorting domain-containing protein, partial [Bacteroidetes bacterium]|nr:T9SS type A sorting domain-containing protein [Bacteroidota bacterium]